MVRAAGTNAAGGARNSAVAVAAEPVSRARLSHGAATFDQVNLLREGSAVALALYPTDARVQLAASVAAKKLARL